MIQMSAANQLLYQDIEDDNRLLFNCFDGLLTRVVVQTDDIVVLYVLMLMSLWYRNELISLYSYISGLL